MRLTRVDPDVDIMLNWRLFPRRKYSEELLALTGHLMSITESLLDVQKNISSSCLKVVLAGTESVIRPVSCKHVSITSSEKRGCEVSVLLIVVM